MTKLLDMRDGYAPIRNVLGMSDPCVAHVDGRWTMFIGGMGLDAKTNILTATLPRGDTLASDRWQFTMVPGNRWRAARIVDQPARGQWNRCMHSVCYVEGMVLGEPVRRLYHAGRAAETVVSTGAPYRIGYLEMRDGRWVSRPHPLEVMGLRDHLGVLEPKVEYVDGYWHMRYLALRDPGDDKNGEHTILYSKSADGETNWSDPVVFADAAAGFYDSVVLVDHGRPCVLALTRDSNLSGATPYPQQGVWFAASPRYSPDLADWSAPSLTVVPEYDQDGWYRNGMCSPSLRWSDHPDEPDTLYVFFVTATARTPWPTMAYRALRSCTLPPVPAPFYFAIGKARIAVGSQARTREQA